MVKHDAVPRQVVDNSKKTSLNKDLKISILRSPVSSDRIISSINDGKSIFTDSRKNLSRVVFQEILGKIPRLKWHFVLKMLISML